MCSTFKMATMTKEILLEKDIEAFNEKFDPIEDMEDPGNPFCELEGLFAVRDQGKPVNACTKWPFGSLHVVEVHFFGENKFKMAAVLNFFSVFSSIGCSIGSIGQRSSK